MQIMKFLQRIFPIENKNSTNIGILTYDVSINYGAHLQAWALTKKRLRISDILALNVSDVKDKTYIRIIEQKTGKLKKFPINSKL